MFMFKDEKKRLYQEIDSLRERVAILESWNIKNWEIPPYGLKKDGTPKSKPGRKPK